VHRRSSKRRGILKRLANGIEIVAAFATVDLCSPSQPVDDVAPTLSLRNPLRVIAAIDLNDCPISCPRRTVVVAPITARSGARRAGQHRASGERSERSVDAPEPAGMLVARSDHGAYRQVVAGPLPDAKLAQKHI